MTEDEFYRTKGYERLSQLGISIENDLLELGNNILAFNKAALDIKLTKKERLVPEDEYDDSPNAKMVLSPVMYGRVCVKGKTIVIGNATKDKKFTAILVITGDPDFPPQGSRNGLYEGDRLPRIYVGQNINIFENYIGMSAENITKIQQQRSGVIGLDPTSFVIVSLAYKDNKVSELYHHNGYEINSPRIWDFATQKAKELGLIFVPEFYPNS